MVCQWVSYIGFPAGYTAKVLTMVNSDGISESGFWDFGLEFVRYGVYDKIYGCF